VAKKSIPKKQQSEMKKPKLYECSECKEKFAQFASADKHCKRNSKGAVCPICGVKISHSKNLNRHIKKTHQNPITKQMKVPQEVPKCDDCGKTFKMMHKYREHMKNKHEIQLSKVHGEMKNCPVCEFQNQSISRIRAHITIYHSATPGEFQCDQCDFVCRSKSGLRRHVIGMHKLQEGDHPEGNKQHITDTGTGHYNQTLNNLQSSVLTHAPLVPRHDQDTGSPRSKTYDSQHSQNYVRPHSQTNFPPHSQTYVPTHPQTNVPPHSQSYVPTFPQANLSPHPQTNVPPNSQTYVPPSHGLTRDRGVMMSWEDYKRMCEENGCIITTQDNRTYYDL
jgi:uncharacterized C2H2 Zn-finger protein